ncbi:AI-2E family transporter [Lutimonas vermicola]|uniref:AI-2E family transporter n=1 Tax=Lutimonas vermicola TaxID=414288 RepID=A0ABU9L5C0_9FLAO
MKTNESKNPIDVYIKIVLLSLLLVWSFYIVRPFVTLIVWSIIVAVALYPFYQKLMNLTKGKKKGLVTTVFILILVTLIILPTISLTGSIIDSGRELYQSFNEGTLEVPPPADKVKEWPLIGKKIHGTWSNASQDLENFIVKYKGEISNSLGWLFSSFAGLMGSVALGLFALIIAGVFMSSADIGYQSGVNFVNRLSPGKGEEFMSMCVGTIRSVVKGILLVAIIQAALAYLGFVVIGLPAASLFAFMVLIFAIIQIPALLAMIPAIAIVFSYADTTPAIIFTVYVVFVAIADNFLKPMLLGKGLTTPMLVILIGALGGMMLQGILGLFIGPVVLALGYQIYSTWIAEGVTGAKIEK